jgi:hypothetical protein
VNGVNLARAGYEYLALGRRAQPTTTYSTRHRWVFMRLDFLAYRALARDGPARPPRVAALAPRRAAHL